MKLNEQHYDMTNFNILKVEKVTPNSDGKVCLYSECLKQKIELPYPEFDKEIIVITANPIYRDLDEETMSVVTALYSEAIGPRTAYFLRPFSDNDFDYYTSRMEEFKSNHETWVPFFPEEKSLAWLGTNDDKGLEINIFKNISFCKDWVPVSHAPYVNRVREKIYHAIMNDDYFTTEDYIDFNGFDIAKFERDDSLAFDSPCMDDFSDETYNMEFFGSEDADNLNDGRDDVTACLAKLFGEE